MIKPFSTQHEYTLVFSGDPSLSLPEDAEEKALALKNARDTGDWSKIMSPSGDPPTRFHCAPISRSQRDWIIGEVSHSAVLDRPLSAVEMDALVIRVALRRVDGFGSHKVERVQYRPHGHWLAKPEILDAIHDEAGQDVIPELAGAIWERTTNPIRPL